MIGFDVLGDCVICGGLLDGDFSCEVYGGAEGLRRVTGYACRGCVYGPEQGCATCGRRRWWQRPDSTWVCGVCHPAPRTAV